MMITFKTYIFVGLLTGALLSGASISNAQTAENNGLADFSIEFDEMPSQPSQIEGIEDGNAELNIDQIEIETESIDVIDDEAELIAAQPGQQLNEVNEFAQVNNEKELEPVEQQAQTIPYSGTYYDANSISGNSLTNINSPRQMDPKYEPGSSFVVVQKTATAGSVPALITAAQRALDLGRYSSALEIYESLYSQSSKNVQVLMGLAVAQQKSGFTESAIATYEELLKIDPDNTDAIVNMLGLVKAQYPAVAYRRLSELWENNPNNAFIAGELGLLSASMGQPQDALRYLGVASSLDPNNASHLFNMAVINDRAGQTKTAIQLYEKALEVDISFGAGRTVERDMIYDRLSTLRRL